MSGHGVDLLQFKTYSHYLDSFVKPTDIAYVGNRIAIREQVRHVCGVACVGGVLTRAEFETLRDEQEAELRPLIGVMDLFSDKMTSKDPVVREFAKREKLTRMKNLSCIVFLNVRSKAGLEISGYIDLEQSFRNARATHWKGTDWLAIFLGKARLMPQRHHLSFWDWKKNVVTYNDSDNFRRIFDGNHSLLYMDRGDRKIICINAGCECRCSKNAVRSMHYSPRYGHVIFFDHKVRRMH